MEVYEGTIHKLADQKRLEDDYKDPDMLPKLNKAGMAGMVPLKNISDHIMVS